MTGMRRKSSNSDKQYFATGRSSVSTFSLLAKHLVTYQMFVSLYFVILHGKEWFVPMMFIPFVCIFEIANGFSWANPEANNKRWTKSGWPLMALAFITNRFTLLHMNLPLTMAILANLLLLQLTQLLMLFHTDRLYEATLLYLADSVLALLDLQRAFGILNSSQGMNFVVLTLLASAFSFFLFWTHRGTHSGISKLTSEVESLKNQMRITICYVVHEARSIASQTNHLLGGIAGLCKAVPTNPLISVSKNKISFQLDNLLSLCQVQMEHLNTVLYDALNFEMMQPWLFSYNTERFALLNWLQGIYFAFQDPFSTATGPVSVQIEPQVFEFSEGARSCYLVGDPLRLYQLTENLLEITGRSNRKDSSKYLRIGVGNPNSQGIESNLEGRVWLNVSAEFAADKYTQEKILENMTVPLAELKNALSYEFDWKFSLALCRDFIGRFRSSRMGTTYDEASDTILIYFSIEFPYVRVPLSQFFRTALSVDMQKAEEVAQFRRLSSNNKTKNLFKFSPFPLQSSHKSGKALRLHNENLAYESEPEVGVVEVF